MNFVRCERALLIAEYVWGERVGDLAHDGAMIWDFTGGVQLDLTQESDLDDTRFGSEWRFTVKTPPRTEVTIQGYAQGLIVNDLAAYFRQRNDERPQQGLPVPIKEINR